MASYKSINFQLKVTETASIVFIAILWMSKETKRVSNFHAENFELGDYFPLRKFSILDEKKTLAKLEIASMNKLRISKKSIFLYCIIKNNIFVSELLDLKMAYFKQLTDLGSTMYILL